MQSLYVEREGGVCAGCRGGCGSGVGGVEVRNSNVALARERDEMKRRFERSKSEQVKAIAAERSVSPEQLKGHGVGVLERL